MENVEILWKNLFVWKKVHGIVLTRRPRGEIDLDAQVLTYELGKVLCIVKGGRKSIHRFVNVMHPSHLVELWLSPLRGTSSYVVEAGELRKVYKNIVKDPYSLYATFKVLSLISELLPPFIIRNEILKGLELFLEQVDSQGTWYTSTLLLLLFLLKREGYIPSFKVCDGCGREIMREGRWSAKRGFLCLSCAKGGLVLNRSTLNLIKNCDQIPFVFRVKLSRRDIMEVEAIIRDCSRDVPEIIETFLSLKHLNLKKKEVRYAERKG